MKFNQLKLLSDEHVSVKVVAFLRQHNIDVLDVKEQGWRGEDDEVLLEKAYQNQRFMLTYDSDFGGLAINLGQPYYGIIYLRLHNLRAHYVNSILGKLLISGHDFIPGSLVVVEDHRIRIRQSNIRYH